MPSESVKEYELDVGNHLIRTTNEIKKTKASLDYLISSIDSKLIELTEGYSQNFNIYQNIPMIFKLRSYHKRDPLKIKITYAVNLLPRSVYVYGSFTTKDPSLQLSKFKWINP